MKLGFADREAYFGDPEFVDVPLDDLLSDAFAAERVKAVDRDRACPDLPQAAIEAPRFASESFPGSFWPHAHKPGVLRLEPGHMRHAEGLEGKGHVIVPWPKLGWRIGGVCAVAIDEETGDRIAGADPRRECTALAW